MSVQTLVEQPNVQEREPEEHPRVQIRNRVKAMLAAVVPDVAERIFISRELPLEDTDYPNILIYTEGDSLVRMISDNPRIELRRVQLVVTPGFVASAVQDKVLQDRVDRFCDPIEQMFTDNPELVGLVNDTAYSDTQPSIESDGEGVFLQMKMTYNVEYERHQGPLVDGHKFLVAGVEFEIDDTNTFVEMEDTINLPQESEEAA